MENLTNLKICIEKPLPDELHSVKMLKQRANSGEHLGKLKAAFYTSKLWPKKATIKISFKDTNESNISADWTPLATLKGSRNIDGSESKLDPIEYEIRKLPPKEAVKKVVRERIAPMTDLNFVFLPNGQRGDVRIGFDPHKGANSLLGTDCLKSKDDVTLNLGWLDAGTIIHEFGHVIGLIHEHQNPGGKGIDWDDNAVYEWAKQTQGWDHDVTYHNIIEKYDSNQINGSVFDPQSIMLYFFPPKLTVNNKGTNANHRLSIVDIEYTHKIYDSSIIPEQFYKQIYGEVYKSFAISGVDGNDKWSSYAKYALIIAVIIVAGFMIYKGIKKTKVHGISSQPTMSIPYRSQSTASIPYNPVQSYSANYQQPTRSSFFQYSPTMYE